MVMHNVSVPILCIRTKAQEAYLFYVKNQSNIKKMY